MRIPNGPAKTPAAKYPTLRTSHIRTYGAGVNVLDVHEDLKGCPAQYRFKYVERIAEAHSGVDNRLYGSAIHDALYRMEDSDLTPDEALAAAWPPELPVEMWAEAKKDLDDYMARETTLAEYATLGVETELYAPLYEDEEFGPVWFGGRIDRLALDVTEPSTLHMVDYKTNRFPPSRDDVRRDVQLMGYDWLCRMNWPTVMPGVDTPPRVVVHLDAVKWFDVEWMFDDDELELWRQWAESVARSILRDDDGRPKLNPGCTWCDYRGRCPAWRNLPKDAPTVDEALSDWPLDEAVTWMQEAKATKRLLEQGIADVKGRVESLADAQDVVTAGGREFSWGTQFSNDPDLIAMHDLLGSRFYDLAKVSKAEVERSVTDPMLRQQVLNLFERRAVGKRLKDVKAKGDE